MSRTTLADFRLPRPIRRTLHALAVVALPDELEPLGLTEPVVDHFELMMRVFPSHVRLGMVAGLATFEAGAIARYGRPFSRLPRERQRAWFDRWWHSPILPIRQLAKAIRSVLAMSYYEHPVVKQQLEYHPDAWIARVAKRRLEAWAADIRAHEEMVTSPDPLFAPVSLARKGVRHAS